MTQTYTWGRLKAMVPGTTLGWVRTVNTNFWVGVVLTVKCLERFRTADLTHVLIWSHLPFLIHYTLNTHCPDLKSFSLATTQLVRDSSSVGHLATCITCTAKKKKQKNRSNEVTANHRSWHFSLHIHHQSETQPYLLIVYNNY